MPRKPPPASAPAAPPTCAKLWTVQDVSDFLGVPVATLHQWRYLGTGPAAFRVGKHLRYDPDVVRRWLAEVGVSKNRGMWVDPALGRLSVEAWSRVFLEGLAHLKPSTRERYVVALRAHVVPTFGNVPLARVAYTDVATWVQGLVDRGLSPATVRYAHRVFSLLLDSAVKDGRVTSNPATGVRLPRIVTAELRFLTVDQVETVAEHAEPYSLLVRVLAYTGLRWGEAAALKVRRVDLLRRRIGSPRRGPRSGEGSSSGRPRITSDASCPSPASSSASSRRP